jgi:hypothetical protein
MNTTFPLKTLKDRDKLEGLDIDQKILEQVLYKKDGWMLSGFVRSHE